MKQILATIVASMFLLSIMSTAIAEDNTNIEVGNIKINGNSVDVNGGEVKVDNEQNVEINDVKVRNGKNVPEIDTGKVSVRETKFESGLNGTRITRNLSEADRELIKERLKERKENNTERVMNRLLEKNPNIKGFYANLTQEERQKFMNLSRSEQESIMKEGKKSLNKYIVKTMKAEFAFSKRQIAKEKLDMADKNFEKADKKYNTAKEDYEKAKQNFDIAVKSKNDTEAKLQAKIFLSNAADMVIASLEKVKEKAQGSTDLTESEVAQIVSDTDTKIAEIQTLKQKITDATTKEDIKTFGASIISAWNRIKPTLDMHANKIVEGKVGEIIQRSDALEKKLERIVKDMEAKNISISNVDSKITTFSNQVGEAKTIFSDGKDLLSKADALRSNNMTAEQKKQIQEYTSQAREKVKAANEKLKTAHETLVEIAKEIKTKGGDLSLEDDNENVTVVEKMDNDEQENQIGDSSENVQETTSASMETLNPDSEAVQTSTT